MSRRVDLQSADGVAEMIPGVGIMRAYGTAAPANGTAGYGKGCLFINLSAAGDTDLLYINQGTLASSTFTAIPDLSIGADLLATTSGKGASLVGVIDAGGFTAQITVEAALAEIYQHIISVQAFIPIPLESFRIIASNDIPALAGTPASGISALDTAPKFKRVNAATDKALKIEWAASSVIEIAAGFQYPPDMDVTATYTVNLRCLMGGGADTPTVAVGVFEGTGDTNRGGNTAALTSALATKSVTVTPTGGHPKHATVCITPGTHGTDVLQLLQVYILYKRKLLTS